MHEQLGLPRMVPVGTAKKKLLEEARTKDGGICPVCDRVVKLQRRPLNQIQVCALFDLVDRFSRGGNDGWYRTRDLTANGRDASTGGGEFARMRFFGLIEQKTEDVAGKTVTRRGYWRPTALGIAFALGRAKAPAWVEILDGKPVALAVEQVDRVEAFGEPVAIVEAYRAALSQGDIRKTGAIT